MKNSLVVNIYSNESKEKLRDTLRNAFNLEPIIVELPISENILESLESTYGKFNSFKFLTKEESFEESTIGLLENLKFWGPEWKTKGIVDFPENSKTFLTSIFKSEAKIYSEIIGGVIIHLEKGEHLFNNL